MIDEEINIFNILRDSIKMFYPKCEVSSNFYTTQPTTFPAVSIIELENIPVQEQYDSGDEEKFATVTYQVDAYSNLTASAKNQVKHLLNIASSEMYALNGDRTAYTITNMADGTITRATVRYVLQVDNKSNLYRR